MEPTGCGRRRTPGLRREELAQRAGISATWCAWLEQGREVQASPHALSRLARALGLTRAERAYLFDLAGRHDPEEIAPAAPVPPALLAAVAAISCPVYGLDRFWNVCCWNAAAQTLFATWLTPGRHPNLLRYIFTDPSARDFIPDWDTRALRLLAEFRADYSRGRHDPEMAGFVAELTAGSAEFARGWQRQSVLAREGGLRTFRGPDGVVLPFQQHTLVPPEQPDYKLVMLVPVD